MVHRSHRAVREQMIHKGLDTERLGSAVGSHLRRQVITHDGRTAVFD